MTDRNNENIVSPLPAIYLQLLILSKRLYSIILYMATYTTDQAFANAKQSMSLLEFASLLLPHALLLGFVEKKLR